MEVVAYCANLGNGPNRKQLEEKAKRSGAIEFVYEDLKDKFSQDFVFPIIRAGAVYEEEYLLGTAIARPHF